MITQYIRKAKCEYYQNLKERELQKLYPARGKEWLWAQDGQ